MSSVLRSQKVVEMSDELVLFDLELAKSSPDETPSLLDSTETCSIDSGSIESVSVSRTGRWNKPYNAPPIVHQSIIILLGVFLSILALIWVPLILLFSFLTSKLISYSFRVNDDASTRRQMLAEFGRDEEQPDYFRNIPNNIQLKESYWVNQRGMVLFSSLMTPTDQPIKAVICYCHAYTDCTSFTTRVQNQRFVQRGIAVASIEYEGHGHSDGPLGLITGWERLVDDVSTYFGKIAEQFADKPIFLMGESMGGAVAYCSYNLNPDVYTGVVFVSPMCKICEEILPPDAVLRTLFWFAGPTGTTNFLGILPIVPIPSQALTLSHKVPEKRDMARRIPTNYARNPRLATAREIYRATKSISASLSSFTAPFLVIHGEDDRVTDPRLSELLYAESPSKDKSIKLYDGMWHCFRSEPDEDVELVYSDIISWILERSW